MSRDLEILLVEDYEPDAHIFTITLARHRVTNQVRVSADPEKSLEMVAAAASRQAADPNAAPLVVLLDIRQPKMDGWELLRRIRQVSASTSIYAIMVTGSIFPGEEEKAVQLGALGCLAKPIRVQALNELLNRHGLKLSFAPTH